MLTLTDEQRNTLTALLTALDEVGGGVWPRLENAMAESGIEDPEAALENLREAALNG